MSGGPLDGWRAAPKAGTHAERETGGDTQHGRTRGRKMLRFPNWRGEYFKEKNARGQLNVMIEFRKSQKRVRNRGDVWLAAMKTVVGKCQSMRNCEENADRIISLPPPAWWYGAKGSEGRCRADPRPEGTGGFSHCGEHEGRGQLFMEQENGIM